MKKKKKNITNRKNMERHKTINKQTTHTHTKQNVYIYTHKANKNIKYQNLTKQTNKTKRTNLKKQTNKHKTSKPNQKKTTQ